MERSGIASRLCGAFVGEPPLTQEGESEADEWREFTMSVIGLLIALLPTSCSHARPMRDKFRPTRTREADELLIAPDRPTLSVIQRLIPIRGALNKG